MTVKRLTIDHNSEKPHHNKPSLLQLWYANQKPHLLVPRNYPSHRRNCRFSKRRCELHSHRYLGPIDEQGRTGWNCAPEKAARTQNARDAQLPKIF